MVGASSARSVRGRRWVALGLALAFVGAAACSGAGEQGGKALRYGFDFESGFTNTFDISKSASDCDQIPGFYIYDSLIHWNARTETLEPGQALTWKLDGRTVTLTLRHGLKFQDGEPFNSEAVKLGLERNNLNKELTSLDIITSIDIPDPYTVVLHNKDDTGLDLFSAFTGPLFDLDAGTRRAGPRPRRPIPQASLTLSVEASNPTMSALARHAHRLRRVRDRHPFLTDSTYQQAPAMKRQTSVTVTHEDLRC